MRPTLEPDPASTPAVQVLVLTEGRSDAVVVEVLAAARGLLDGSGAVRIVAMDGVTNVRSHLVAAALEHPSAMVLGLYDAGERRYVARALGLDETAPTVQDELEARGFFVCDRDLEDELIRALGPDEVQDVLHAMGDLDRFRTFQNQPEWRGRPVEEQLRRFAGSGSGRKIALAERLARRLDPVTTPEPLARLVDRIEAARG